jgi:hypothetical protein
MVKQSDEVPEERESTRIRAFLAKVKPLSGTTCGEYDEYWEGRSLIEGLALAFETGDDTYRWHALDCAAVVNFLHWIEPVNGSCFCNDDSRVNATCGFHAVLEFMADEMRRLAQKPKGRKRAAEVAHG